MYAPSVLLLAFSRNVFRQNLIVLVLAEDINLFGDGFVA
jgi:hypothetical protein